MTRETRLYDAERDETRPMRGKELSDDYRYFPEPDLLPVHISEALLAEARAALPELPRAKRRRYQEAFGLNAAEARQLAEEPNVAAYFEAVAKDSNSRRAAHWMMDQVAAALNRSGLDIAACPVPAVQLARLLQRIDEGVVSGKIATTIFDRLWRNGGDVDAIIEAHGLRQVSDVDELAAIVAQVVAAHPDQALQFRAGKSKVLGFFVGQVMQATSGKADPKQANTLLLKALADG